MWSPKHVGSEEIALSNWAHLFRKYHVLLLASRPICFCLPLRINCNSSNFVCSFWSRWNYAQLFACRQIVQSTPHPVIPCVCGAISCVSEGVIFVPYMRHILLIYMSTMFIYTINFLLRCHSLAFHSYYSTNMVLCRKIWYDFTEYILWTFKRGGGVGLWRALGIIWSVV